MPLEWIYIGGGIIAFIILLILLGYVKAPPDRAYIISGLRRKPKVIIGKASVRIPFLERLDKLTLELIPIDVKTDMPVPTSEFININVDGVANVKIGDDPESIRKASQNFLGRRVSEIQAIAQQVLEGNMREIIGQLELKQLVHNRDQFAANVQSSAADDMARMGLIIVNLTIQNFTDINGVINDLGIDNIVQIQKDAAIARARGEKDIKIAQSDAMESANLARTQAEAKIASQDTDLAKRKAELQIEADTMRAEADAAYAIQSEEQRKRQQVAAAQADLARKNEEVKVQESEVMIKERMLDAERRKVADADRYEVQQRAEAALFETQQRADAARYEAQQRADASKYEAQLRADADLYSKKQEAEAIRLKAEAEAYAKKQEAEAVKEYGLAEAFAIENKAEAQQKMASASILEMYFTALPEVVKNASEPLSKIDKLVMYGSGNTSRLVGDVMSATSQVTEAVKEATGLDIAAAIEKFAGKSALAAELKDETK